MEIRYIFKSGRRIRLASSNKFPKGETAILTAVEKKFGEDMIGSAQETIHKMTAGNDQEIEKIKKLAGVK